MKKIISILTLLLAFSVNSNAQSAMGEATKQAPTPKETIYQDILQIAAITKMPESLQNDFMTVLLMREEAVANVKSDEDKKAVFEKLNTKMLSALSKEQIDALKSKKDLYNKLFVYPKQ
jgi:hypothetical protein